MSPGLQRLQRQQPPKQKAALSSGTPSRGGRGLATEGAALGRTRWIPGDVTQTPACQPWAPGAGRRRRDVVDPGPPGVTCGVRGHRRRGPRGNPALPGNGPSSSRSQRGICPRFQGAPAPLPSPGWAEGSAGPGQCRRGPLVCGQGPASPESLARVKHAAGTCSPCFCFLNRRCRPVGHQETGDRRLRCDSFQ